VHRRSKSLKALLYDQAASHVAVGGWDLQFFPVREIPSPRAVIECPCSAAALRREILSDSLFSNALETAIGAISDSEL
jgi:hypothetical protein